MPIHSICRSSKQNPRREVIQGSRWARVKMSNDPEKVSSRWVKHPYGLVDELYNMETEMIGMKPKDAIKLNEVPLVNRESYPPENTLPEDGLYRYLLQPGEEHNDQ